MVDTRVELCGITLDNPVIPASGTYGYGYEFAELYDINCLGTFSFKGTTREARFGNPTPRIAETASGLLNAVGLQNPGVDAVIAEELPKLKKCFHKPVMANISGFSIDEYTEVCSFIEEILEKADSMLENIQLRIESRLPGTPIFTLLDREQMERAIYNLLSNAAKYGRPGTPIQVQLQQQNQRLRLSVTNSTDDPVAPQQLYDQFLRELTLEDPAKGLGLGLLLVRRAAVNHGGVLLMDQPARGNTRLTMTFAIRHSDSSGVRSPIFGMDYAGERDHALLELADVLPAELYRPEKN